jgi:cardiolipin synthase
MSSPEGLPAVAAAGREFLRRIAGVPPAPRPRAGSPRGYSDRLLDALGEFQAHPVTFGNRVEVFRYGRTAFDAMLEAIDAARDHVHLESYVLAADATGRAFGEALARAAGRGVAAHLVLDAVGSWATPDAFLEDLERRGVHVVLFHPVRPWRVRHGRWLPMTRNHRKILVVDGRVGFTGGINIADEYASDGVTPGRWRDAHFRIEGPSVARLQRVFLGTLFRHSGREVEARDWFPRPVESGDHAVRVLPTSPLIGRPYVRIVLRRALRAAQRSIHATQAYFVPDTRVLYSLRSAARRGVDVSLVVPSRSDVPAALHAGRGYYSRLLRDGVRIHERLQTILHAKTVVVDGEWTILGSANMDIRSFRMNYEVSVDVLGRDLAERMEDLFREDLAASRALDSATWAQRPLGRKIKERFFGLFADWL